MSALTHQIGFALGTVTREIIRAVTQPPTSNQTYPLTYAETSLPGPCLPAQKVTDLSLKPAIVRAKGVDLYDWYEGNTREITKAARKRRQCKRQVNSRETQPSALRMGPLALSLIHI